MAFILAMLILLSWFRTCEMRSSPHCEKVNIDICLQLDKVGYSRAVFPNFFNHTSQEEAMAELDQFRPLVKTGCARDLALFLCSVYIPLCLPNPNERILPCRSLCRATRAGCEPLMNVVNYRWPPSMNCSLFPKDGGKEVCISTPRSRAERGKEAKHLALLPAIPQKLQCPGSKISIRKVCYTPKAFTACDDIVKSSLQKVCNGKSFCLLTLNKGLIGSTCMQQISKINVKYQCVTTERKKHNIRTCFTASNTAFS